MRNKTFFIVVLAAMLLVTACADTAIDRHALVMRNNPHVTKIDSLHSLTVGNGRFAFTADATGLQTFPEYYKEGLSLGTYSEWGSADAAHCFGILSQATDGRRLHQDF